MTLSIAQAVAQIKQSVADCLSPAAIEAACREVGHQWRERQLGPVTTVHAFLTQVLHGNTACEHAVRLADLSCSATAYCQARKRLPLAVWQRLLATTTQAARGSLRLPLWREGEKVSGTVVCIIIALENGS